MFSCTRLKYHVAMWWDYVKLERWKKNKEKITSWDRMVVKLKSMFLLGFYQLIFSKDCNFFFDR